MGTPAAGGCGSLNQLREILDDWLPEDVHTLVKDRYHVIVNAWPAAGFREVTVFPSKEALVEAVVVSCTFPGFVWRRYFLFCDNPGESSHIPFLYAVLSSAEPFACSDRICTHVTQASQRKRSDQRKSAAALQAGVAGWTAGLSAPSQPESMSPAHSQQPTSGAQVPEYPHPARSRSGPRLTPPAPYLGIDMPPVAAAMDLVVRPLPIPCCAMYEPSEVTAVTDEAAQAIGHTVVFPSSLIPTGDSVWDGARPLGFDGHNIEELLQAPPSPKIDVARPYRTLSTAST
jgi:hypothetical protein